METNHNKVSSTMVESDDDKFINKISTANAPNLKDTESASTRNSSQRPFECKGYDDVVIPRPDSSKTKVSTAEKNKGNDKLRYISKYLVQFVPDAKQRNKETVVSISGARVLISDKCAAILKEHKEKIKKQQENGNRTKEKRQRRATKGRRIQLQKKAFSSCKEGRKGSKER